MRKMKFTQNVAYLINLKSSIGIIFSKKIGKKKASLKKVVTCIFQQLYQAVLQVFFVYTDWKEKYYK